jgi:DNA-3-methyladenine glycosylase I
MKHRCPWCKDDPTYVAYHDEVWGLPVHDDKKLFEMLILEGAQAGLNWLTILKKQEGYRQAYNNWDIATIAAYGPKDVARLLADPGIVRNRLKVKASITNAKVVLQIHKEFGSLDAYLWRFVGGKPIHNHWKSLDQVPSSSDESDAMSRDLKKRGCTFVGSTICYAFMQATGMVNDHLTTCFRHAQVRRNQRISNIHFPRGDQG